MTDNPVWLTTRQRVIRYALKLQAEGLVYATAGNLSIRIPGDPHLLAVTPTSMPYDELQPDDIPIIDLDGAVVDGHREPTVEVPMHTMICARRPEVGAVVHTHSVGAMAMAALGWDLPPILTGLVEAAGGGVRVSAYSRSGSAEMADFTDLALRDRGATFLRHHGLLAVGVDIERALRAASVVEKSAQAFLQAKAVSAEVPELPPDQVAWIAGFWGAQWPNR